MGRIAKKIKDKSIRKFVSSTSYDRNLGTMKLLISDPEFQQEVNEIQVHLKIPEGGFESGQQAKIADWHHWFLEETDKVMDEKQFIKSELRINEQARLGKLGQRMLMKQKALLYHKAPLYFLDQEIRFLIDKFNLPLHYDEFIKKYIITGKVDAPQHNYKPGFYPTWSNPAKQRYLPLNIYTRLTKDEIKELQNYINWAGKNMPKYPSLKNIDRDLKFEQWVETRMEHDPLYAQDYKVTAREIAEEKLGSTKKAKKIYESKRNLKRLRDGRFRQSGKSGPQISE